MTASKFKSVFCSDTASPPISLVMSTCCPEAYRFSTTATKWGCQHEKAALERYESQNYHRNIKVTECGLFLSEYPFIGASPDAVVTCNCCAKKGICEAKVSTAVLILYCIIVLYVYMYICMYVYLNSTLL